MIYNTVVGFKVPGIKCLLRKRGTTKPKTRQYKSQTINHDNGNSLVCNTTHRNLKLIETTEIVIEIQGDYPKARHEKTGIKRIHYAKINFPCSYSFTSTDYCYSILNILPLPRQDGYLFWICHYHTKLCKSIDVINIGISRIFIPNNKNNHYQKLHENTKCRLAQTSTLHGIIYSPKIVQRMHFQKSYVAHVTISHFQDTLNFKIFLAFAFLAL